MNEDLYRARELNRYLESTVDEDDLEDAKNAYYRGLDDLDDEESTD